MKSNDSNRTYGNDVTGLAHPGSIKLAKKGRGGFFYGYLLEDGSDDMVVYIQQPGFEGSDFAISGAGAEKTGLITEAAKLIKSQDYNGRRISSSSSPEPPPIFGEGGACSELGLRPEDFTGSWRGPAYLITRYTDDMPEYNVVTMITNKEGWVSASVLISFPGEEFTMDFIGAVDQNCQVTLVNSGSYNWYMTLTEGGGLKAMCLGNNYDMVGTELPELSGPPSIYKFANFEKVSKIPKSVREANESNESNSAHNSRNLHCNKGKWKGCKLPLCDPEWFVGTWEGIEYISSDPYTPGGKIKRALNLTASSTDFTSGSNSFLNGVAYGEIDGIGENPPVQIPPVKILGGIQTESEVNNFYLVTYCSRNTTASTGTFVGTLSKSELCYTYTVAGLSPISVSVGCLTKISNDSVVPDFPDEFCENSV